MHGAINHLALTVRDLAASEAAFYAPLLGFLGYEKVEDTGAMTLWWNPGAGTALNLWQASGEAAARSHTRTAPGFHHLAFSVEAREDVAACHDLLVAHCITVLDPPADYPHYAPGYHAVFFADPDGMKFEVVHMPAVPA